MTTEATRTPGRRAGNLGTYRPGKHLVGLAGTVSAGLAGIWLMTAPFALLYQPGGAEWADATQVGFFTGLGVLLVSVAGAALLAADLVGALRAAGVLSPKRSRAELRRSAEARETTAASAHDSTDVDLQQILVPLAASLLKELQQPGRPQHARHPNSASAPASGDQTPYEHEEEPRYAR